MTVGASWLTLFLDVSEERHPEASRFWPAVTGYTLSPPRGEHGEFSTLLPPTGEAHLRLQRTRTGPVRVLLQRLEEGSTSGHLDIASSDREAEVGRLIGLGATRAGEGPAWTVLTGPDCTVFCVTDRDPATGLLPGPPG